MRRPPIRILDLSGSPEDLGARHGAEYAGEIRQYTRERVDLVAGGGWSGGPMERDAVLEIAESMLPAHERFDADLHTEMLAMADAAGISPAEAVIVGGFTDFVDTVRAVVGGDTPTEVIEDDCTAVIVPDSRAGGAGFLGQTWDMHDTATDHVVLLRVRPDGGPRANVFTTTGCLGQIGMNTEGVCVGINNLTGVDGARGVCWTSVVRGMLMTSSAAEALDVLLGADLAGAHNFLIFDRHGDGYDVEAMPSTRPVVRLGDAPDDIIVHTNHTLDPAATAVQADRAPLLTESSTRRLELASQMLAANDVDADRLIDLFREPTAICQTATAPLHIESSGAAVMRPGTNDFWACWGRPVDNDVRRVAMPLPVPETIPDPPGQPVWVGPTSGVRYFHLDARWAEFAVALERQAFPNTDPDHLLHVEDIEAMAEAFPEGCFVGLDDDGAPACTGFGIRTFFDWDNPQHGIVEFLEANGTESGHVPDGDWYYGTTIVVRPDLRRRGIGHELYQLRKDVVRRDGLRGIVAGGVIPGYAEHRLDMTADEYIDRVRSGDRYDSTLSFQLENDFEAICALKNYMPNPLVDDHACLIRWPTDGEPPSIL
ncbi:MAG: C45 family autoproteolytic acyltransferase/hydrolase [Actinomycetota bacterium]